jgi:N-acetylglucosamine-6-phosphate deacetylase
LPTELRAQNQVAAQPIVGLRDNRPRDYAFQHAEVVIQPGHSIADATVLITGTSITAVGADIEIPSGFMTIDCTGKRIYAGLIDAWSEADVPHSDSPAYWNTNVTPQRSAATVGSKKIDQAAKLRSQGITARVVAPKGGIVKGSSCVVLLGDAQAGRRLLTEKAWQHLQLTVPRESSRPKYPNSPMGAVALVRQSMYDANWYRDVWEAYRARPELARPETNVALDALAESTSSKTFVIDAPNERMAIRADHIAREFSLKMIVRGSGREYRQLDQIVAMNRPILVPVDFPEPPNVKTTESAQSTTLQELMHWDIAPENPARLAAAGLPICLTTDGLDDVNDFLKQVRTAVKRGLPAAAALAAMTTVPARLLKIDDHVGRVQVGMLANLVITDGDLLAEKTKVLECWVAGEQFVTSPPATGSEIVGTWQLKFRAADADVVLHLELKAKDDKLSGVLRIPNSDDDAGKAAEEDEAAEDDTDANKADADKQKNESTKLKDFVRQRDRMTATVDLSDLDSSLPKGITRLTWMTVARDNAKPTIFASVVLPNGDSRPVEVTIIENDEASGEDHGAGDDQEKSPSNTDSDRAVASSPTLFPLGAYGLEQRLTDQPTVVFRGATIWTCEEQGTLESADILIRDGLIAEIGQKLQVPAECQIIDARGKHITPGLIDCHSHMGTDGGVNESGQAVTAEVRIGDFIDNSDIQIYRQLAGGLTTSNILHGSANPIGGQNQVIKLRWGETMDGLRMKQAPPGIKFALGENVKRNQSRYPNTRMGVEQVIRDQLLAAREYDARWRRWRAGQRDSLPPRTDLQLEAMAEVQRGERWIHCHSYRQDEIVATLDVLDEFGIQIGTLQHILEGYKVADRMAKHGAMGSSFSDWWAYKFEVFDAIPYNGALMHDRGVVVSFNSDDRELARHLNTEAAKATKYGGVPETEALKFVTLNPAKQLRIDQYVGSLAVGKHADLVVWNGRPLSTMTRCEQTWIDGKRYFDLQAEQELRQRDVALRARLIQKALTDGKESKPSEQKEVAEEDRWVRHDIHCAAHGGAEYDHSGNGGSR